MRKRKHLNKIGKMILTAGILCFTALPVEAKVTQEDLANPVVDVDSHHYGEYEKEKARTPVTTEHGTLYYDVEHITVFHYVYFGSYPQRELKGEELTQDIINASYDEYGNGFVNGRQIRRLSKELVTTWGTLNGIPRIFEALERAGGYRYFLYEPIKWRILSNEDSQLLLLTDKAIDLQMYTDHGSSLCNWKDCDIRRWLNYEGGEPTVDIGYGYQYKNPGFLYYAFSEEERGKIQISEVIRDRYPRPEEKEEEITNDKIFILGLCDLENKKYGMCYDTGSCEANYIANTDYCRSMSMFVDNDSSIEDTTVWLRTEATYAPIDRMPSPGLMTMTGQKIKGDDGCISLSGHVGFKGTLPNMDTIYVQPATRVGYTLDDCIKVSFQTNTSDTIEDQVLLGSNYVMEPETVTNGTNIFMGWYLDEACTKPYLFDKKVTEDTTLYAGWKQSVPTGVTGGKLKIEGTTSAMEYASSNKEDAKWSDCQDGITMVPNEGTWYVRYKKTPQLFESESIEVQVANVEQKVQEFIKENQIPETVTAVTQDVILAAKDDKDIAGSSFITLQAEAAKATKKSVKLKWKKQKEADGYLIYGAPCNTKKQKNPYQLIETISSNNTVTYTHKQLKKGRYYKYIVAAYKDIEGQKVYTAISKTIHVTTSGGRYGNAKAVKIKTGKGMTYKKGIYTLQIKKNKKYTIHASEVRENKKIQQHRKISFESDNKDIAIVTSKGIIKAKKKGSCNIYVYGQNGVYAKIQLKVK